MAKPKGRLTPAQLEIMQIMWQRGRASAAEVWEEISNGRNVAPTTVATLLQRLERRGWLTHKTSGRAFVYSPAKSRKESAGEIAAEVVDMVFDGSAAGLFMSLLGQRKISRGEIRRLKRLLDDPGGTKR